jgi:hypothetical protein
VWHGTVLSILWQRHYKARPKRAALHEVPHGVYRGLFPQSEETTEAKGRDNVSDGLSEKPREIKLGSDGRCECNAASQCPLGRTGMAYRCTKEELLAAGCEVAWPAPADPATPGRAESTKYRKKPVVIEAVQWDETTTTKLLLENMGMRATRCEGHVSRPDECTNLVIVTPEGLMHADKGDWIIKGIKGEFYPCKPDIFAATYEPAAAPAPPGLTAADVQQVPRYFPADTGVMTRLEDNHVPSLCSSGGWVRHTDYAKLAADRQRLVEERDQLSAKIADYDNPQTVQELAIAHQGGYRAEVRRLTEELDYAKKVATDRQQLALDNRRLTEERDRQGDEVCRLNLDRNELQADNRRFTEENERLNTSLKTLAEKCANNDAEWKQAMDTLGRTAEERDKLTEEVAGLRRELEEVKSGYDTLNRNWDAVHQSAMGPIRRAVGDPDASVPEIVGKIEALRAAREADQRVMGEIDLIVYGPWSKGAQGALQAIKEVLAAAALTKGGQ